jgi:trimeric autotransporter adhesin
MFRYFALACLAVFGLAAAEHHGQVTFGGLPVPGATVIATQGDKRLSAVTNQQGDYSFPDLADGNWKIRVEMLCFEPIEREVAVAPNAPAGLWELKMLPMAQIAAQAPPPAPAAPAGPASPTVAVAAAPAKGKSKKDAPAATPQQGFQRAGLNASNDAAKLDESDTGEAKQNATDGFLINGSVNNGAASPFAQSAAFGNSRRGPRSLYTGGIGFTADNSTFNARPFSLTGQDTPQAPFSHVTGLASFGGPLWLPHVPTSKAPNVFVNYQWTRNRDASTMPYLMPDADQRAGIFSSPVIDPATGSPFPGNVIPQSRISPQAAALLRFYPLPNFTSGSGYNYQVPLVTNTHQDSMQARWNKSAGRTNQLSGMFAFQSTRTTDPSVFEFQDHDSRLGMTTNVNWMHRYTTRMFQNVNLQFSRMASQTTPFFANRENISGEAGITGNNQEAINWGPPGLVFSSGIAGLNDATPSVTRYQTSGITYSLMWVHGSHTLTVGGDYRRQQFNLISQQNPRGTFTFTGAAAGSDFAGFLLGVPDTSAIAYGNADKYFRDSVSDAYFTDDWRVGPGLTLNAGVRWDYGAPITEQYGRLVNLDVAGMFGAVAPVVASNPIGSLTGAHYGDSLLAPDRRGVSPRIGFAWHPLLASSLVIRGGYGIYYDTSVYTSIAVQMAQQPPLSTNLSVANSTAHPLTLANAFYLPPSGTTNTFAIDPNFRVGYSQNWQLSVQRDLPGGLVATATYQGSKGTRARQEFLPNTWPTGAANPCPACPSGFLYETSNGNSTREAGLFQLRRRLRSGFTATLQYTFAKAIDDAALGGRGQGTAVIAQNWLDLTAERGLSPFDQRHLLNATLQYSTGVGVKGGTLLGGWKGAISKDWTITTQITAGSGTPLTPVYPQAVRGTGMTGSIRPDYTGQDLYDAPDGLHLNPAAVAAPASGQWGNAGRDSITGPSQFSLNGSLSRTFRLSDRWNADFRVDAMNALNHVTYPSWVTMITSAQFGLPATANAMRTLRTTFRLRF